MPRLTSFVSRPVCSWPSRLALGVVAAVIFATAKAWCADEFPRVSFVLTPSPMVATTGDTVQLTGSATGTPPLSYQWSRNGVPLTGATTPTLTLPNLTVTQSGRYTLTATNGLGSATTDGCYLTVVNPGPVSLPVDPYYAPTISVSQNGPILVTPATDGRVLVLNFEQQSDGKYLTTLERLNADGTTDTAFETQSRAALDISGTFPETRGTTLEVLADGRMLIAVCDFNTRQRHYARLFDDGRRDPTFVTPTVLPGAHVPLGNGRFVVVNFSNNVAELARFTATGERDSSYPERDIVLAPPHVNSSFPGIGGTPNPLYDDLWLRSATLPSGQILVAFVSRRVGDSHTREGEDVSTIMRLNADGTMDPTFRTILVHEAIDSMVPADGKIFYVGVESDSSIGLFYTSHTGRLNADSSVDTGYTPLTISSSSYAIGQDGSIYFLAVSLSGIARFDSNGVRDPEFSAPVPSDRSAYIFRPLDGGAFIAAGIIGPAVGTVQRYLARFLPDKHASTTRLANLSIRQIGGTGTETLTEGFIIRGLGSKTMLLRGIGPTLANFGFTRPLSDPSLSLYDGAGARLLGNDNWGDSSSPSAISDYGASVGAFALPANSKDAAALTLLPAGPFTVQIGNPGVAAVALAEVYDGDSAPANYAMARVTNFSALASAGQGDATFIAGFMIRGPNVKRVLLRAIGPSLAQFGVAGTLADPQLTLFGGATPVASKAGWSGAADISAAFNAAGAFPLATSSKDAALLVTLPPGAYTAIVTSTSGATGKVLLEVYEVR